MNAFNRGFVILLSIALIIVSGAIFLVTVGVFDPQQVSPTGWIEDRMVWFQELSGNDQALATAISLALIALGLLLLLLELKPSGDGGRMTLSEDALGKVTVQRNGIAALANYEAMQVDGVRESRAEVQEDNGRLYIREHVSVAPQAEIPAVSESVRERVKNAIEQHVGWSVAEIEVDARVETPKRKPRVA